MKPHRSHVYQFSSSKPLKKAGRKGSCSGMAKGNSVSIAPPQDSFLWIFQNISDERRLYTFLNKKHFVHVSRENWLGKSASVPVLPKPMAVCGRVFNEER